MAKEYILKDRFGKDHTHNDETIYVRGTDGELMPFTQGTVEPLTITENGTYTAPDGVSYNPVTVEVAGSGGGSLPAGVYLEPMPLTGPKPTYGQKWVWFKDAIYAFVDSDAGNYGMKYVYRWDGTAWTLVVERSTLLRPTYSQLYVEHNGKIHVFGSEKTEHNVFDGTNMTASTALPNNTYLCGVFTQNGKLKAYSYKTGTVYVWSDTDNTWATESVITTSSYQYYSFFTMDDGTVYACISNKIYTYDGKNLTLVVSTTISPSVVMSDGKRILFYQSIPNSGSQYGLYTVDLATGGLTYFVTIPCKAESSLDIRYWLYNKKFCLLSGLSSSTGKSTTITSFIVHEVTE